MGMGHEDPDRTPAFDQPEDALHMGRVDRAGMDIRVRGQLKAQLLSPCDRCLTDVPFAVDVGFDLFYAPLETGTASAPETELQERDLGFEPRTPIEIVMSG